MGFADYYYIYEALELHPLTLFYQIRLRTTALDFRGELAILFPIIARKPIIHSSNFWNNKGVYIPPSKSERLKESPPIIRQKATVINKTADISPVK